MDRVAKKLILSHELAPSEPLWKRVPSRDADGNLLSDFMMIIPKLRSKPKAYLQQTIEHIQQVLIQYHEVVIFADLNLKLNVLWVTVKPIPGICLELPTAIQLRVPEALLVAHKSQYR